ncbi:hypothetical protein BGZ73_000116 [Actinomortierella ambigua]|nr:hypothetical protein BGZ73_000116 [Actinomortierella ambigua]
MLMTDGLARGDALTRRLPGWWRPLLVSRFWYKVGRPQTFRAVQWNPTTPANVNANKGMLENLPEFLYGCHQLACDLALRSSKGSSKSGPPPYDIIQRMQQAFSDGGSDDVQLFLSTLSLRSSAQSIMTHPSLRSLYELSLTNIAHITDVQRLLAIPGLRGQLTLLKLVFARTTEVPAHRLFFFRPSLPSPSATHHPVDHDIEGSFLFELPRLNHLLLRRASIPRFDPMAWDDHDLDAPAAAIPLPLQLTTLCLFQVRIALDDLHRLLLAVGTPSLIHVSLRRLGPLNGAPHRAGSMLSCKILEPWTRACPNLQWVQTGDWVETESFQALMRIARCQWPGVSWRSTDPSQKQQEQGQQQQQQQQQQDDGQHQLPQQRIQHRIECLQREVFDIRTRIALVCTRNLYGPATHHQQLTRLEVTGMQVDHTSLSQLVHSFLLSDAAIHLEEALLPGLEYDPRYFDPCPPLPQPSALLYGPSSTQVAGSPSELNLPLDPTAAAAAAQVSTRPWACKRLRRIVLTISPYAYYCTTTPYHQMDMHTGYVRATRGVCGFMVVSCPLLEAVELRVIHHALDLDPEGGLCFLGRLRYLKEFVLRGHDFIRQGPDNAPWPYEWHHRQSSSGKAASWIVRMHPWHRRPMMNKHSLRQPQTFRIPSPWSRPEKEGGGRRDKGWDQGTKKKMKKLMKSLKKGEKSHQENTKDGQEDDTTRHTPASHSNSHHPHGSDATKTYGVHDHHDDRDETRELVLPILRWMAVDPTEDDRVNQWTNLARCRYLRQLDGGGGNGGGGGSPCDDETEIARGTGKKWPSWKRFSFLGGSSHSGMSNGHSSHSSNSSSSGSSGSSGGRGGGGSSGRRKKRPTLPEWAQALDSLLMEATSQENTGTGEHSKTWNHTSSSSSSSNEGSQWQRLESFTCYLDCIDFHKDPRMRRSMEGFCAHYETALREVLPRSCKVAMRWNDLRQFMDDVPPTAWLPPIHHGISPLL